MRFDLPKGPKKLREALRARDVTKNSVKPIEKECTAVLQGMLQKVLQDEHAIAAGAGPCKKHPGQVEGVCPICRGIWSEDK